MQQDQIQAEFLKTRQTLLGFIFALTRDHEVAEEVFQEVALAILQEASKGIVVERFLPWAREIVRRRVASFYLRATLPSRRFWCHLQLVRYSARVL